MATGSTRGSLERGSGYLVFAQRASADAEVDAWNDYAMRFFGARLGLADGPRDHAGAVELGLVVAPEHGPAGVRTVRGRRREVEDLAAADAAEGRSGGGGLAGLARRCDAVWLVETQSDADATALLLAAVLAGAMLGPILDARTLDLFGVKTARAKLSVMRGPPREA